MRKTALMMTLTTLTLFLAGCPSEHSYLAAKPPAFQEGYRDGCKNAEEMVVNSFVERKDNTERYKNDPIYRDGWDDGYSRCYANKEMDIWMDRPGILQ